MLSASIEVVLPHKEEWIDWEGGIHYRLEQKCLRKIVDTQPVLCEEHINTLITKYFILSS